MGLFVTRSAGFSVRFDARALVVPSRGDSPVAPEFEFLVSLYRSGRRGNTPKRLVDDPDGDGIVGAADKCPKRAEDFDSFQDADGCPEVDNDADEVLDIADRCPEEQETRNGYKDNDGCPDVIPAGLRRFVGSLRGVAFASNSDQLKPSAFKKLERPCPSAHRASFGAWHYRRSHGQRGGRGK